jgi:hypothetical protein
MFIGEWYAFPYAKTTPEMAWSKSRGIAFKLAQMLQSIFLKDSMNQEDDQHCPFYERKSELKKSAEINLNQMASASVQVTTACTHPHSPSATNMRALGSGKLRCYGHQGACLISPEKRNF